VKKKDDELLRRRRRKKLDGDPGLELTDLRDKKECI
jgi:hypothetical protein